MPLNYEKLRAYDIPDTRVTTTPRDAMLYAVGVGLGADPTDERQLRFCYEKDLRTLPSMATVIAAPHAWLKKAEVGSSGKSVHAGIGFRMHRPIPVEGTFRSENTLGEVIDKGEGKAALVATRRRIFHEESGQLIVEIDSTSMARGDGGFGGENRSTAPAHRPPDRAPDVALDMPTLPQSALIYRLSGDFNPLHADPEAARRAGFERPILHGLCTYGIAGHALLAACCDYEADRLRSMCARFSKPVYPGDTLSVRIWRQDGAVLFEATVPARKDEKVLSEGYAEIGD